MNYRLAALPLALAMVLAGPAAAQKKVAVLGTLNSQIITNLNADGYIATAISIAQVEAGLLSTASYDAFVFGRNYYNTVSTAFVNNTTAFLNAGGGLVSEWDGAAFFFSGYQPGYRFANTNPQAGIIAGQIGAGGALATDTPITNTGASPVTAGLANTWSAGSGSEFFFTSANLNPAQVDILATYQGNGTAQFPAGSQTAILAGKQKAFVALMFDAQDNPNDADIRRLFANSVGYVTNFQAQGAVPEPSTWALMILGFGAVGGAMRRRTLAGVSTRASLTFA
jgi:hypothetical protein